MDHTKIALAVVQAATEVVRLKHRSMLRELRRAVCYTVHLKQRDATELDLVDALAPVFRAQVAAMVRRLRKMEAKSVKAPADEAAVLVGLIFDPDEWRDRLVDAALPVLALAMARSAVAFMLTLGIDIRKSTKAVAVTSGPSTASEWLDEHPENWESLVRAFEASGVPIGPIMELPLWMRTSIAKQLTDSFSQPYWNEISRTTGGDAERVLGRGLQEGWSIRRMADEMSASLGGDKYAKMRATRIARTESPNALNGARRASMDELTAELGPEVPMRPSWLSVLADTTRDTHAILDGVPADDEGLWNVGGYMVPWPGHHSLPAGERCNCLCVPGYTQVRSVGRLVALSRMLYNGPLVELVTRSGVRVHLTPNHPVLTTEGWIAASQVKTGMHLFRDKSVVLSGEHEKHKPSSIEQVFESYRAFPFRVEHHPRFPFQFHGDAEHGQGEIEAIVVDVELANPSFAERFQDRKEFSFVGAASELHRTADDGSMVRNSVLPSDGLGLGTAAQDARFLQEPLDDGAGNALGCRDFDLPHSRQVGGQHGSFVEGFSSFGIGASTFAFRHGTNSDSIRSQPRKNRSRIASVDVCDLFGAFGFVDIHPDEVVGVRFDLDFSGHVYDLQTESGVYLSQSIIAHNCTITIEFGMEEGEAHQLIDEYNQRVGELESDREENR